MASISDVIEAMMEQSNKEAAANPHAKDRILQYQALATTMLNLVRDSVDADKDKGEIVAELMTTIAVATVSTIGSFVHDRPTRRALLAASQRMFNAVYDQTSEVAIAAAPMFCDEEGHV